MKSKPFVSIVVTLQVTIGACSSADTQQAAPVVQLSQQPTTRVNAGIIVKPKTPVTDGAALMRRIGEKLRAPERVAFNRPMSGDAYVLRVVAAQSAAEVQSLIAELSATGLFEYVEADSIMTIHDR